MLNAIIESSLNNRFLVLMVTLLVAGLGVYSAVNLPIDAVPDLTNVQVQVITEAPALSPLEVESLLSFPVEGAMSGLPNVEQIRSISKFGISVVTIVFQEGTDIYRARQLVGERLSRAAEAIPAGYGTPMLGPIATALGEVFQFQVKATPESKVTPMELRTLLDWFIAYQLRKVPGVTEINAHGGELKTYQVEVDPDALGTLRLSMTDVFNALQEQQRERGGWLSGPRGGSTLHPGREPGAVGGRHRGHRHRRTQRRARDHWQGRQGPPRADDPGGAGHPRRPRRDRHGPGHDADRPERPEGGRPMSRPRSPSFRRVCPPASRSSRSMTAPT